MVKSTVEEFSKAFKVFRFDNTINLGHILTFVGFIATGFTVYLALEKRVTVLETVIQYREGKDAQYEKQLREYVQESRETVHELRLAIREIDGKVTKILVKEK